MFWITLMAILGPLLALFGSHSKDGGGAFGASLFLVAAILVLYLMGKTAFSHKAMNQKATALDAALERLVLPLAMIALVVRHTTLLAPDFHQEPLIWGLALALADPANGVRTFLLQSGVVQSERLLKGIVRENPTASSDYLPALLAFCVAYVAVWL